MLYHLLFPLHESYSFFNVFRYITFRTIYAAIDHTTDRVRLREAVRGFVAEGDVVLVKGSRGMRLDEVAAELREVMA